MEMTLALSGRITAELEEIRRKGEALGFDRVSKKGTAIRMWKSEAEDVTGKTTEWYEVVVKPRAMSLTFTVKNEKELKRIAEMHLRFLQLLLAMKEMFEPDPHELAEMVEKVLERTLAAMQEDQAAMYEENQQLKAELDELKKKYDDFLKIHERNTRLLLECEKLREQYLARLNELLEKSDEEIKDLIFNHLKEHNGEIDVIRFAQEQNLPVKRVEKALNELIKEGYIRRYK